MRAARSDLTTVTKPFAFQGSSAVLAGAAKTSRPISVGSVRGSETALGRGRAAAAWICLSGAGLTSGGGRRLEFRPPGSEGAQALVEARPGPGLDLAVARQRLVPRRLEVLEPGVRLLDLEQLLRFANRPGEGVVVIVHRARV